MVINGFEQALGTALCFGMLFVLGWLICGFVPFTEFLIAGLTSSMQFPYLVALFAVAIIAMTIHMCWFVRATRCGDHEDQKKIEKHEAEAAQVQREAQMRRARSAPNIVRHASQGPGNLR